MRASFVTTSLLVTLGLAAGGCGVFSKQARQESPPSAVAVSKSVDAIINALKQGPISNLTGGGMALYVLDVKRGAVTLVADRVTDVLDSCGSPAWTRDGRRILLDATPGEGYGRTRIKSIDVSEGKLRLTDLGPGNCPSPSPDGKRIVFFLNSGADDKTRSGVWILRADGSTRNRLDDVEEYGIPRWSPAGSQVLLKRFGNPVVHSVIDLTDEAKPITRQVKFPGHEILSLSNWADDGKTVVAAVRSTNGVAIVFVDVTQPAQAKLKQVVWRKGDGLMVTPDQAAYSARTGYCVFTANDAKGCALYWLKVGQSDPPKRIQPTDYGKSITSLAFSPDGRYLLFCSIRQKK